MLIHPTAVIDTQAHIDPTVKVGPYTVIEGPVKIGPDCHLHSHVKVTGRTTIGSGNTIHSFAVIGDTPQDLKFKEQLSELVIGSNNIFREHTTVHCGTNGITRIGSNCFFMVGSHVGHNAEVHDFVTMVNGSRLGGHSTVFERAIVGAGCAIHQNARVGRLAMVTNNTAQLGDVPPYCISMHTAVVTQINHIGLRRSGMSKDAVNAIRQMFKLLMRDLAGIPLPRAVDKLSPELLAHPEVREFVDFVKSTKRGVAKFQPWSQTTEEKGTADATHTDDNDGQNA
jgi:UDP-N-acetylglucosamine acyltransferase